jgi:predicted XRE-type DNA-binding protein
MAKVSNNKKTIAKKDLKEQSDFKKYLAEIERPDYDGADISFSLPKNATPLEKAKYKICERILSYQQDNNLPIEEIANKIKLTTAETKDIFHYHLNLFTFDRLMTYASRLFSPSELEINIEEKKNFSTREKKSNLHERVF